MEFTSIRLKNFMSFHDDRFEDLDRKGLTLIEGKNLDEDGSNGAGKSSLWDGISFALFGQTVRGLKGNDVVHRKFGKECEVRLEFFFKGIPYIVVRQRKPDRFYVEVEGKIVELGTQAMTQDWLNKQLEIDYDLFRSTVVFAQEETFNFVDATNKEQKEILSKIMRISYDQFQVQAKDKIKELKEKQSKFARDLDVLNSHLIEDPDSIYAEEIEEWEQENKEKIKKKIEEYKETKQLIEAFTAEDVSEYKEKLKNYESKSNEMDEVYSKYQDQASSIKAEVRLMDKMLGSSEELMKAPECPTCGGKIDGFELAEKLKHTEEEKLSFMAKLEKINEKMAHIQENKKKVRDVIHNVRNKIAGVQMAQQTLGLHKDSLKKIKAEIESLRVQENPWHKRKKADLLKQDEIKTKIEEITANKIKIDDSLPYFDFWVNAFGDSGIKSFVFDLVCSTLTTKANYYLNILSSGKVMVTFDTQKATKTGEVREKFDCDVIENSKSVPYKSYSGGEKRRISLAVDLALSDLMSDYYVQSFNIVVLDEQSNYLDKKGRVSYMELLKEMAKNKHVFVVDHDSELKAMFDDVIVIQKQDGISTVLA
jgi:DNA repair exonuclease SbcCD ATPase subunit